MHGMQMSDKEKKDFRDKLYRLLAELLADQMGGTLVSLEFVKEVNDKEKTTHKLTSVHC